MYLNSLQESQLFHFCCYNRNIYQHDVLFIYFEVHISVLEKPTTLEGCFI